MIRVIASDTTKGASPAVNVKKYKIVQNQVSLNKGIPIRLKVNRAIK